MTSIRSTDVPATILLVLCLCQLPISILTSLLILFSLFFLSPTPRKHDDGGCRGPPAQPDVYSVYPALYRTIYRLFCPPAGRPTPRTLFRTVSRYPAFPNSAKRSHRSRRPRGASVPLQKEGASRPKASRSHGPQPLPRIPLVSPHSSNISASIPAFMGD